MKKAGFTMVELLAVITLLGVLATVAVTSFSGFISQAKNSTYSDFETTIEEAATNYMMSHAEVIPSVGSEVAISATTLIKSGYLDTLEDPESGKETCNTNSYVVIRQETSPNGFNLNLKYAPCIICSNYKSSTCKATRPTNMK